MPTTESGTYRVYRDDHGGDNLRLLESGSEQLVDVQSTGYDDPLQSTVDDLRPGYLVEATLEWPPEGAPSFTDLSTETRTLFEFVDGTPDIFEQARETYEEGKLERMPIYSNVTYNTDGDPNGVIYTFAKQDHEKDIFAEFKNGQMTLEPMIEKLADGDADPPYEVFVIRPESPPFLVVYLTLEKGGLLPNTIREEYNCPRPADGSE